jgi:hypothetical protein
MAGMTLHQIPVPVQVCVIAVCCLAIAWFRYRQGKTYWLTIAWWIAIAWALWTTVFVLRSFLSR